MVREPEELPEVTRAKLRLREVASRPAELPAALRAAPGVMRLLRPRQPAATPAAAPVQTANTEVRVKGRSNGRTLLTLAGVAAAAVAAGFLISRSPETRRAAAELLARSVKGSR